MTIEPTDDEHLRAIEARLTASALTSLTLVETDGDCTDFDLTNGALVLAAVACTTQVARFFAAAPDDIRYLVSRVHALESELAAAQREVNRLYKLFNITG